MDFSSKRVTKGEDNDFIYKELTHVRFQHPDPTTTRGMTSEELKYVLEDAHMDPEAEVQDEVGDNWTAPNARKLNLWNSANWALEAPPLSPSFAACRLSCEHFDAAAVTLKPAESTVARVKPIYTTPKAAGPTGFEPSPQPHDRRASFGTHPSARASSPATVAQPQRRKALQTAEQGQCKATRPGALQQLPPTCSALAQCHPPLAKASAPPTEMLFPAMRTTLAPSFCHSPFSASPHLFRPAATLQEILRGDSDSALWYQPTPVRMAPDSLKRKFGAHRQSDGRYAAHVSASARGPGMEPPGPLSARISPQGPALAPPGGDLRPSLSSSSWGGFVPFPPDFKGTCAIEAPNRVVD